MYKIKDLIKLEHFNRLARIERVYEPTFKGSMTPNTGIECPGIIVNDRVCRAHLTDGFQHQMHDGKLMHPIYCGVCLWKGWREIGRERIYSHEDDA